MRLRIGCRFDYESEHEAPSVVMVEPHPEASAPTVRETWSMEPIAQTTSFQDLYGNRCRRLIVAAGESHFAYDATVEIDQAPERMPGLEDVQHRIEALPSDLLHWLLPSRYCQSDELAGAAWDLFGHVPAGAPRVQAVCDWVNQNIAYGVASLPTTTVAEIYARRGGMCRDFAHLGVTFCRALGIPARYVFGYMPDIGIPGPYPPMDFHAWFEVWLGEHWWTYDARFNTPRIGRVPIGHGRDAVDVSMVTSYGAARLVRMQVWADEVPETSEVGATRGG